MSPVAVTPDAATTDPVVRTYTIEFQWHHFMFYPDMRFDPTIPCARLDNPDFFARYRVARDRTNGTESLTVIQEDICTMVDPDDCYSMGHWTSKFELGERSIRYQFEDAHVSTTYSVSYDEHGRATSIKREESNPENDLIETFSIERNEANQITRLSGSSGLELSYCHPGPNTVVISGAWPGHWQENRVARYRFDRLGRLIETESGGADTDCPDRFDVTQRTRVSFDGERLARFTTNALVDQRFTYDCTQLPD